MSLEATTKDGWKLALLTATGPSADTTVDPGASANIDLTLENGPVVTRSILAVKSINGLATGLVIAGISYPATNTVRVTVYNATGASITVASNSVTAEVLVKGF